MKPLQRNSLYNDLCSCTSYYSSDADDEITTELVTQRPQLHRKINKKYNLPLKEDQLLEKIFKTRALYEIVRNQLLSNCTSDSSKTDVKCRPPSVYYWEAPQKAAKDNDPFTLNDKGAVSVIKGLSETCSCCSCRLKRQLHEYVRKRRRNRQAYINENIASRSSLSYKQDNAATKNIKSDPCTCACKHKHKKDCERTTYAQKYHVEQPEIRQRDRSLVTEKRKPLSLNNKKTTYYKLKQCSFAPYMEHIGEEGNRKTQNFTKLTQDNTYIKRLASLELLRLLQNDFKDSFRSDINSLSKFTLENQRVFQNPPTENNKDAFMNTVSIQFVDKTYLGHTQNAEPVQKYGLKPRKYKRINNKSDNHSINTATTKIKKTKNVTDLLRSAKKQQNTLKPIRIQNNELCVNMLQISNQIPTNSNTLVGLVKRSSKSLASMISPTLVANTTDKHFRFSKNTEKESSKPIKRNTSRIVVKILKSISTSSIKKKSWLYNKNSTVGDCNMTLKINLSTSFHKLVTLLSSPMQLKTAESINPDLSPSLVKSKQELPKLEKQCHKKKSHNHKNPSLIQTAHKKMQPKIKKSSTKHKSSIALRRCFCNFNIKIEDTRSNITKSYRRTKFKESKFSLRGTTHASTYKSLNIKKKKRRKGDQHYQRQLRKWAELQLKMDLISKNLTKQAVQIQHVPCATLKSSIHTASAYQNRNMKTNDKESENLGIINKEKFDTNDKSKNMDIICESSSRLKTKFTLKDASIGNDEKKTFQNQSVQTINNKQSCGVQFLPDQIISENKVIETIPSKPQRNKSNTSKPVFNVTLFNKNWRSDGFKYNRNRIKHNKSPHVICSLTRKSKAESIKNGLRKFCGILKLGKLKNKYKEWNKIKLPKETLNKKYAEVESFQTSVNNDFYKPIKDDFRTNQEGSKVKNIIKNIIYKSRANTRLPSQFLHFPRMKDIQSILSPKREIHIRAMSKFANSARKFFNSLHFTVDVPIKKQVMPFLLKRRRTVNEVFFINTSKVSKSKSGTKSSHKLTLLDRKRQDSGKSVALKIKRCLYSLKLHKRGKYNKKKGAINIELKSKIMSEKMYPSFRKHYTSTKSKYSNPRFDQSKQLILLFMPRKCNPYVYYSESKNNNPKSCGLCTRNTKTISVNTRKTRKVAVDYTKPSNLLCVEKLNSKQRSRLFTRINNLEKQPHVAGLSEYVKELHLENSPMQISYHEILTVPSKSFCISNTLKNDEQRSGNTLSTPFAPKKPTQVYTVNTVTLTETKISPDVLLKDTHHDSTDDTLDSTTFESKIGSEISCVNNNCSKKLSLRSVQSLSDVHTQNETGMLSLLRRRNSAMNIHDTDQNVIRNHPNNSPRLKSVPYQRQTFVVGRLVSKMSTMLSTEKRFKTSHSSTLSKTSTARKHLLRLGNKVKHRTARKGPIVGFKYQTLPRSRQPYKRNGYTFGFSNDFPNCKSRAIQSTQTYDRHFKKSSGCYYASSRYRRPSQWTMSQVCHKVSNVSPILRGCVCALKLHKKGRLQKAREMQVMNQGNARPIKINADQPVITPMGKVKSIQNDHYLELGPCKCEPGICIPDECDSIWRLILGKKVGKQTKYFKVDSTISHFSSSSNMTPSWERMAAYEYGSHRPVKCRDILARPNQKDIMIKKARKPNKVNSRINLNTYDLNKGEPRNFRKSTHEKIKDKFSQGRKQKRHIDFQTDLHEHGQTKVASRFLKRCFCTLKVLVTSRNDRDKPGNVGNEKMLPTPNRNVVKSQRHDLYPHLLSQDYKYDKPMKIQKPKEKKGGTTRSRTKLASSSTYMRPSKSERIQYRTTKRVKGRKHHPQEIITKEKKVVSPYLLQKPTAQFGSAYYPEVRVAAMKCSHPKRHKGRVHFKKTTSNRRSRKIDNLYRNRESQMHVSKSKALRRKLRRCFCTLKLHTQKPVLRKVTISPHKEVNRHFWVPNSFKSLPYNLEHYGCNPLVCVPGECDPYKCENRTKVLLMTSLAKLKERYSSISKSISEDSEAQNVMQRPKLMKARKHQYGERKIQFITNMVHTTSTRTAKITSNNNFYLDFFKDKTLDDSSLLSNPIQNISYKKPRRVINKSTGNLKKNPKGKAKCRKNTYAKCKNPNKSTKSTRNHRKIRYKRERQSHTHTTKDDSLTLALLKRCFFAAKFWSKRSHSRSEPFQIIKSTKKSDKTNPPQILAHMACKGSTRDKNDNNIMCHPADNGKNELTFKNVFNFCKSFFNEQSNEKSNYNQNQQTDNSSETPNNKQPLVDILKSSKSERRTIAATTECIKKSKSLKVAKPDTKVIFIKNYSQFQSGDAASLFKKKSGFKSNIRKVCQNSQVQLERTVSVKKKVHFATVCSNKTISVKTTKEKEDLKPILCLFESNNCKHCEGKLCLCGCAKRKTYPCPTCKNLNLHTCKISNTQTPGLECIYIRPRRKKNKIKRSKKEAKIGDKMYEEKKLKKLHKAYKNERQR